MRERRRKEADLTLKSNHPNLKGGEKPNQNLSIWTHLGSERPRRGMASVLVDRFFSVVHSTVFPFPWKKLSAFFTTKIEKNGKVENRKNARGIFHTN